jgi:hypothetical protein
VKVLVFVKATPDSEKGLMPTGEKLSRLLTDMGKFNDELIKAGILKDADGLKPSRAGKRITFSDTGYTAVIDGPFAETKELVAGYWIWDVKSMSEAVAWAMRCPNPMPGEEGMVEIRPTYSEEEFAALLPEDLQPQLNVPKPAKKSVAKKVAKKRSNTRAKTRPKQRAKRRPVRAKSKK